MEKKAIKEIVNISYIIFSAFLLSYTISELLRIKVISLSNIEKGNESFYRRRDFLRKLANLGIEKGIFRSSTANREVSNYSDISLDGDVSSFTLKGVIYGFPLSIRRALIQKEGEPDFGLYKLNDRIEGYILCNIQRDYVELLDSDGKKYRLHLFESMEARRGKRRGGSNVSGKNYKKLVISRAEVQRLIRGNMENVLTSMNASLYRRGGEVIGFKVNSVKYGSIAYRVGFRKGDIIKAVNGYRLDSVEKAMELWKILKNENHVKIELERAGKDFILDIEIS